MIYTKTMHQCGIPSLFPLFSLNLPLLCCLFSVSPFLARTKSCHHSPSTKDCYDTIDCSSPLLKSCRTWGRYQLCLAHISLPEKHLSHSAIERSAERERGSVKALFLPLDLWLRNTVGYHLDLINTDSTPVYWFLRSWFWFFLYYISDRPQICWEHKTPLFSVDLGCHK